MKTKILTGSETIFNVIIRNASTIERRLMVDIKATSEAHNEGTINDVMRIIRDQNLEDSMTKTKILPQLVEKIKTGKIKYEIEQSVNHTLSIPKKLLSSQQETTSSPLNQKEEKSECQN